MTRYQRRVDVVYRLLNMVFTDRYIYIPKLKQHIRINKITPDHKSIKRNFEKYPKYFTLFATRWRVKYKIEEPDSAQVLVDRLKYDDCRLYDQCGVDSLQYFIINDLICEVGFIIKRNRLVCFTSSPKISSCLSECFIRIESDELLEFDKPAYEHYDLQMPNKKWEVKLNNKTKKEKVPNGQV